MPNLQGTSPIGHDEGGRSNVVQTVDRSRSGQAMSWPGEILSTVVGQQ